MEKELSQSVSKKLKNRKFKKHWHKAAVILAAIVTFCTTYALILPAITMSHNIICGKEEHTHTDSCYETEIIYPETELKCLDRLSVHQHDESCYDEDGSLICGEADFILHTHDDHCFDAEGNLICTLPEIKEHTHTEKCYDEEDKLVCGEQEIILHTHTEECYDEEGKLICGRLEIKEHNHTDDCVAHTGEPIEKKELVCDKEEHIHTDECYDNGGEYYCGIEEHTHTEKCYDQEDKLICGQQEHTHSDICRNSSDKTLTYSDSSVEVTLHLLGNTGLSEDAELVVTDINEDTDPDSYGSMLDALGDEINDGGQEFSNAGIYDLKILDGGVEAELPADTTAVVDAEFNSPVFSAEEVQSASAIKAYAFTPIGEEDSLSAEELADEYKNTDLGVTGVTLTMNGISPFAVALAEISPLAADGTYYWQKVTSIDDTSANYLIVSSTGYAFGVSRSGTTYSASSLAVNLAPAGVDGYYSSNEINTAYQWNFSSTGTTSTIKNVSYNTRYLNLGSTSIISTTGSNNTVSYITANNAFRFSYKSGTFSSTYYLRYSNTSFSRSTSTTGANLTIYKAVDELPGGGDNPGGGGDTGGTVTKPDYGDFIETSDKKQGEYEDGELKVKYASDPATSQIESQFRNDDYLASKENDGKVITDKSVVYMGDDYEAFETYDKDTFGVTLSALGQQFDISGSYEVSTPLDVVFVLDASGSMLENNAGNVSRAEAMVTAVNSTMKTIYDLNPDNRVGVVAYSGAGAKLLNLGRYAAPNNAYLTMSDYTSRSGVLAPNSRLTSSDGNSYRGSFNNWQGTYTQHGIATGADILINEPQVSYTGSLEIFDGNGDLAGSAPYTVKRKPLIILVSDGDPTYCNSSYDKVLTSNSTIYGNGTSENTTNNKGILGFYTILTANYCKNKISSHYGTAASFYTIGMGINSTGTASSDKSVAGDHYKRAVLNPNASNISALNNNTVTNASTTAVMLYQLLNNTYTGNTVTVTASGQLYGLPAATGSSVPVIKNPYINMGYSYAEKSYVGTNITTEDLKSEFENIIQSNADLEVYAFILKSGTSVEVVDNIGEGMEIKGPPVLRYWGEEFKSSGSSVSGNVTTYEYTGKVEMPYLDMTADMSEIKVTVTKNSDGTQTVKFYVPYHLLPVYSPNISSEFYYEALPARLIYQVGLTDESKADVEALRGRRGSLTYYTNKWDNENRAYSNLDPTPDNPYYLPGGGFYATTAQDKSNNTTDTSPIYWSPFVDSDNTSVVGHLLGNNGKLEYAAEIPLKNLTIPAEKVWGDKTDNSLKSPVTLHLYRSIDSGNTVEEIGTLILNEANGWKGKWTDIISADPEGNQYTFYVVEDKIDGFYISYSGNVQKLLIDGASVNAAIVDFDKLGAAVSVTVTNTPGDLVLPATGGIGSGIFTAAGILIILISAAFYSVFRFKGKIKV